jgi:hypothetical protein
MHRTGIGIREVDMLLVRARAPREPKSFVFKPGITSITYSSTWSSEVLKLGSTELVVGVHEASCEGINGGVCLG